MKISLGYTGTGGVIPVDDPTFFVEIWQPASYWTESNRVWECAEYELSECNVDEALRWAQDETPDDDLSRCVLYAVYRPSAFTIDTDACDVHLRLYGEEPKEETNEVQIQFNDQP